jgi:OmcA/MtrC family decaheme c-type cytochrome
VKYSDLSSKKRSPYHWINFAAASMLAVALAGCGGGGGGGTDTTAAPAAPAAPVVVPTTPTGTAVITAAAASPTTTNTADNPNQAFGLIATVGAAPILVQSPPVAQFAVIDSTGKHVPGLTLFNAAGATADPNCSGSNVTFAIAKFDSTTGHWQNLISRQRYAKEDLTKQYATADTAKDFPTYRYAVVEGTTDPKPTATYANPATAVTDPTARIVGILEENATGGYYTYRFATDVVTPLAMADAVDKKNVSTGKVANNGNVVVKDGKTIYRLGAQLCYTDPATKAKVVSNPVMDFTAGTDGVGVPVKAADGKTLALSRQVVTKDSCNDCHQTLALHGTRVDPNYCVMCHNPGSTDYNTKNPIDLRVMVHRIHFGKELTKDYSVASYNAKATAATTADLVVGTLYPQDIRNCTKCHDGSTTSAHATPQGDNWKANPNRAACGSCHDGINFATGKGLTLADAAKGLTSSTYGHIGGIQTDDTKCALCHGPTAIPVYHVAVTPPNANNALLVNTLAGPAGSTLNGNANTNAAWLAGNQNNLPEGAIKISYDIKSVSVNASGNPSITFRILQNGARADFKTLPTTKVTTGEIWDNFMGSPSVYFVYAVPQDGITAPADFNVSTSGYIRTLWRSADTKQFSGPDADGYYTATLTSHVVPTSGTNKAVMVTGGLGYTYSLPNVSRTTGSVSDSMPLTQTNLADYPLTASTVPGLTAYSWGGLVVVAQDKTMVATGYTGRRAAVADAKCDKCHEQLGMFTAEAFHGGQRNDAPTCSWCHNPNRTGSGWSASSGYYIHAIHGGQKRADKYTWTAPSTTDGFWDIELPASLRVGSSSNGVLKNCQTCHIAGMNDYSNAATTAAYPNMLWPTVAVGLYPASGTSLTTYTASPSTGVATSCVANTQKSDGATIFSTGTDLTVFRLSPYVLTSTAVTGAGANNYGVGFGSNFGTSTSYSCTPDGTLYSVAAGATREADGTTRVISPFMAVCVSCHDGKTSAGTDAKAHMTQNGGKFYETRANAWKAGTATLLNTESCMLCHGPNGVAAIAAMHAK